MAVKLYFMSASPPARAVLVALKNLNVSHELHHVDLVKREHRTEEFIKMNPQHTVPVIVEDDGFIVSDSHAINTYLVGKFAKDDKLYPTNLKKRSIVDHRLHFDTGVLFQAVRRVALSFFFEKSITGLNEGIVNKFEDIYEILEKYLKISKFIAGDDVTVADWSVLTTLANMTTFVAVNPDKFPQTIAYIDRGNKTIPFIEEVNKAGVAEVKAVFKDFNFQLPAPH